MVEHQSPQYFDAAPPLVAFGLRKITDKKSINTRVGGPRTLRSARVLVGSTVPVPFLPLLASPFTLAHPPDQPTNLHLTPHFSTPYPTRSTADHVRRLFAKAEERAAGNSDRTGRSHQESGWCVSPYSLFSSPSVAPIPSATCSRWTGIQLLQAEDLKTWYFSIEVLGESLYKVP